MPRKRQATPEDYHAIFPTRLRMLMEERNTTQQALADALDKKSRQAIAYYADGSSSPDWKTILQIAEYFNVSTDYLFGLTDVQTKNTTIKSVCEATGLSESAISRLFTDTYTDSVDYASFLNRLITSDFLPALSELVNVYNNTHDSNIIIDLSDHLNHLCCTTYPSKEFLRALVVDYFFKIIEE